MTKMARKILVIFSSILLTFCVALGLFVIPKTRNAQAATQYTVKEATLNKINATSGIASDVQYIAFDGYSGNTWFMTEFTGKNAPNYAVRAIDGYSTWDADTASETVLVGSDTTTKAGILLTNSSENQNTNISVYRGTNTNASRKGHAGGTNYCGMYRYADSTQYIQIVGYEIIEDSSANAATIYQYLFNVGADGALTAVTPTTGTVNYVTHVLTGSKAVIYGNIQDNRDAAPEELNPTSVTFKYAQPGTSLSELVNNIDDSYAYKTALMTSLDIESTYATVTLKDNSGEVIATKAVTKGETYTLPTSEIENFSAWLVGETEYQPGDNVTITEDTVITAKVSAAVVDYTVKEATLNKINASSGIANDVQYIAFDGYSGNTWFLTEFVGKNSPNYAVRAVDGYSTWDADTAAQTVKVDGVSTTIAGMLITNSTETQNTNIRIYRSTNTTSSQRGSANANKGGIYRYTDNVRYIQIVGYEAVEESTDDSATLYSYIFTVDANGIVTLLEAASGNATYATNVLTGNKAVIYGNIQDTRATATETLNPSSVTFKYAQPGTSLSELLNNIDNSYAYKNSLMDLLNIDDINSVIVSTKTEDGETISSEKVDNNANYTFPENDMSGFVGWLYNGGLYPAGYVLTLTDEDIVLTAATMELKLDVGAAVRISNNSTQYGGLRFEVMINTADLTALSSYITSTKGMIIPTDLIVGDFDIAESEAKTVALDNMLDEEDGYSHAFITLTNILYANYNREFSAKAYVALTFSNGATAVIETQYSKEDNSRSIYEVAVLAYEDYKSSSVLLSYLNSTLNFKAARDEDGDYVFSTNHTVDGLPADYTRGYSIVSQAVTQNATDENLSDITLTVSMDVDDRLYETNSLPKIPVTIWFEDYRLNIEPTVVSYDKTNKEAVLTVTLATDPSYELGEGEYTIWAYSATCDDWYQYKDENGDIIKVTFEDGTRQTFEHTQWYAEGGFNVLFVDWTFPFKGATESFTGSKLETVMNYAHANGLKVFIYENNLHRLSQFSSTWIDETNGVKETDSMAFNASGTTTFASEAALKAYVAYSLREVKEHPAFYGVSLLDEASYAQFPYIGKIYRAVQEVAPGAFVNMNINPMSNNQAPMRKYSATWAETTLTTFTTEQVESAYQDYLNTYYTEIGQYCGYIQYDNYPILESGILSNHLRTAQVVAEFAEEKNMKFGMVNQTYTSSGRRAPTENDMYWQLNLSMAMGVDLYSYYYYYPVPNASSLPDDTATIVDREGNRNERYYWLQSIHEDMQVVAKAMDNFKYQGLKYYTKGTSIGSVDFLTDVDNSGTLQKVSNVTLASDGVILATELYDDYMKQYGYYVMNATDPLQNASQSVTLTFEGYSHIQVYQDGTIVNYALNNGSITLSLACGRGAFVLPY